MKPSKDALDEYKAMAKNSPGSMESKIKAHLVANCPKYDESRFDSCMQHLVDCAKEILGSKNGEVPDEVCYKICRDYFDDELWATEEKKDDGDKEKEERRTKFKTENKLLNPISRAVLRGERLDDDCKRAHTTIEYGKCVCYGLMDNAENTLDKCKNCKAYVWQDYNQKPQTN